MFIENGRVMIMFIVQKNEASNKTIRMSNTLIEQLEEIAANEDISFNQLVVQCCEYALANLPKNDGKIACTEQFISQKRQIKKAFLDYMAGQSDVSKSTATTIFSDAIFASQPLSDYFSPVWPKPPSSRLVRSSSSTGSHSTWS